MSKFNAVLAAIAAIIVSISPAMAQELGSNNPTDQQLLMQRAQEAGCDTTTSPPTCPSGSANVFNSGTFDVAVPPAGTMFQPAERATRNTFGAVGAFMLGTGLTESALGALVYPSTTTSEMDALVEGLQFFTTFHTAAEGLGPINNQPTCLGCHLNAADAISSPELLQGLNCNQTPPSVSSTCSNVSNVTRAGRSTPTNFEVTSLNPATGGGVAPDILVTPDTLDVNPGKTAAFTTFGNFDPCPTITNALTGLPGGCDAASNPTGIGFFDPLDGITNNILTNQTAQPFGGFVQHHRPAVDACYPKPLPPVAFDTDLNGTLVPSVGTFHRSVGQRAGPPYIGRGLIEAVPTANITANAANVNPTTAPEAENGKSSLGSFATLLCPPSTSAGGCIAGTANMIPRNFTIQTTGVQNGTYTGFVGGVGRFGLRANGVEFLQFIVGGLQGELSFTSLMNGEEIVFPTLFPGGSSEAAEPLACYQALSETAGQPGNIPGQPSGMTNDGLPLPPTPPSGSPVNTQFLEVHLSTPFSIRNLLRNTAPPEFGAALLDVLRAAVGNKPLLQNVSWQPDSEQAQVKRGAELFGIDLVAFANRTIGGPMTAGGDGRDDHAINQADRKLNCVGCHIPIQMTGQSPAALSPNGVGAENLTNVWAPIFSDLLIHHMPVIDAERDLDTKSGLQPLPRDPLVIRRVAGFRIVDTFDLTRNLADDTFSVQKASAEGSQFRTAPLMGIGRIGPPFLHDARVYLSNQSVSSTPAGTVTTNRWQTNAPLAIRSVNDALLAAIELHDLPAPDDRFTPRLLPGAGCPVPPNSDSNINYGPSPQDVICPPYNSTTSQTDRSDAAEVIYRFRQLTPDDQQAVIEFLKQL